MSDVPQGPGWWQASDGKWYPPESFTGSQPVEQPAIPAPGPAPAFPPAAAGAYGYPVGPQAPKNEPLAVASLVTSLVSIPLCLCILGGIAGLVMGIIARNRIKASNGMLTGEGMALAGVIVGGVITALNLLYFVLVMALNVFSYSSY